MVLILFFLLLHQLAVVAVVLISQVVQTPQEIRVVQAVVVVQHRVLVVQAQVDKVIMVLMR
jgi:hypothetical protein